jgi:predicted enzyme related to lactoylglutathione lyase
MSDALKMGTIGWVDLTIPDAPAVRDFYAAVAGWSPAPVPMGGYDDFAMTAAGTGEAAAGICHARGTNAGLPPQWLIYITVPDVDAGAATCLELGGQVLAGPKDMGGYGRYCVIQDPAGAVAALFAPAASAGPDPKG